MIINNDYINPLYYTDKDGRRLTRYGVRTDKIQWIVIHYTGTRRIQGRAESIAKSSQGWKTQKSTHYFVGDDGAFQTVKDEKRAYHCGPYSDDNKCTACNNNAIGVDLVEHKRDSWSGDVKDRDWYFSKETLRNGAELVAMLANKYNIPDNHIIRHFDITGKWCPRPFVGNDINKVTNRAGECEWVAFRLLVSDLRSMF